MPRRRQYGLLPCWLSVCLLLPAADSEAHLPYRAFSGHRDYGDRLGMQVKVLALAPDATDVAMALFSASLITAGIGAGALVGNQVSLHRSTSAIGYIGNHTRLCRTGMGCACYSANGQ